MRKHKNRIPLAAHPDELITDKMFNELAEAVFEGIQEHTLKQQESIEGYIGQLHSKVYKEPHLFCSRLAKGYRVLMEELKLEQQRKPH